MMNEIFLLVGGEATRLQPLSSGIPKALLTIKGEKIIDKIITQFSKFSDFTFNLICSEKHRQHWNDYEASSSNNINLLFEQKKLDTAGYIIENIQTMPKKFLCMNGDLLLDVDLENFIDSARSCTNSLIGSFEVENPSRYGVLKVNEKMEVEAFIEKPDDDRFGNKISLGLYHLFKKDIMSIVSSLDVPCSFERDVFPQLSTNQLLNTYTVKGNMIDVGTREAFIRAHLDDGKENWISPNNTIINKDSIIKNSVILDGCKIAENVVIENSIISNNSTIESGSIIKNEIVRTN